MINQIINENYHNFRLDFVYSVFYFTVAMKNFEIEKVQVVSMPACNFN